MDRSEHQVNESKHKTNNKPRSRDARQQTAIYCRKSSTVTHIKSTLSNLNSSEIKMDAKTIDNLEAIGFSQETIELLVRLTANKNALLFQIRVTCFASYIV